MNIHSLIDNLKDIKPKNQVEKIQSTWFELLSELQKHLEQDEFDERISKIIELNTTLSHEKISGFIVIDYANFLPVVVNYDLDDLPVVQIDLDDNDIYDLEENIHTYCNRIFEEISLASFTGEDAYDIKMVGLYYEIVTSIDGDFDDDEFSTMAEKILKDLGYIDLDMKKLDRSLRYYIEEEGEDMEEYAPEEDLIIDYSKYC